MLSGSFLRRLRGLLAIVAFVSLVPMAVRGEDAEPTLQIDAPADGALVGRTFAVTGRSPINVDWFAAMRTWYAVSALNPSSSGSVVPFFTFHRLKA